MKELISQSDIDDIKNVKDICKALMETPHYKKLGPEGIYAIVEKAKALGISPLDALNGSLYFVQGKIEMSAVLMNQLIRQNKHSVTKDKKSDDQICILHGKRSDNGDTWVESFSIEEAKKAGIYRNQWLKYPKDMLFARALSRLARQLFPDVFKGAAFVQGELSETLPAAIEEPDMESISEEQYEKLISLLEGNETLKANILTFMKKKWNITDFKDMPLSVYDHAITRAKEDSETNKLIDKFNGLEEKANGTEI